MRLVTLALVVLGCGGSSTTSVRPDPASSSDQTSASNPASSVPTSSSEPELSNVAKDEPALRSKLAVTRIDPERGDLQGGTYVRIRGQGFMSEGPRNVKVYFGSRQGTVVRFASDGELIVEAPGGKPGETVDVLVIFDPGGELKLPNAFTFVAKH